ncbi:AfsR/SARP family transcriptional regulator [Hamadaea tsunoensis]|uniref:AfsR/SARP family transcriptional regulator n=1 Tax=Hamadaea tsunoensis TaxID=53368 RepID=UPI000412926D|nr:AfsR/SARP family transcriptional regulator [Hamadaea tsunoensis]
MSELRFRILGPTSVTRDGRDLDLGSPKQRTLLVALLLEPGRVLPLRRVLNLLWADPPSSATANARTYASGLRKVLGPVLHARDGGYLLDVPATDGDLGEFTAEVAAARLARADGDTAGAQRRYRRALGLWRGSCGEDLPSDAPLHHQLLTITERRAAALEELADLRLEQGADADLPAELRTVLADHPTREGLWARLMRALAATGDTAGALEAYQRARAELSDRLGVTPGAELEELHRSILSRDPLVAPARTPVPPRAAGSVPHELPPRPAVFVGRTDTVDQLAATATGERRGPVVLAVDGPGGIGKSALAVELAYRLADRHADGEVYVDLQGGRSGLRAVAPAELLLRLLRSCGEPAPPHEDLDGLAARWRSLTHARDLLVVLDNALDAEQVRPLLPNGSGCTVIVTSRRPLTVLDLSARRTLSILDIEASVAVLRAHTAGDEHGLRRVAELCGGLPLALRMAAARLGARADLAPEDFARRLADDRRRLSELGQDAGVRATFRSSFVALADSADPVDRAAARLFCLLGLLPMSTCAVEGTYALIDADPEHGDACVARLVDLQLVTSDRGRLGLHDLLRLYARELAQTELPPGEAGPALHRVAWFYSQSAGLAWLHIRPLAGRPLPPSPLRRAQALDQPSREAALRWLTEAAPSLREIVFALPALPDVPTAVGVEILRHLVSFDGIAGTFRDTLAVAPRVAQVAAERGDPAAELVAYRLIAINLQRLRRYPEARATVAPAVDLLPLIEDPVERITTMNTFGIFQTEWGDHDDAEATLLSGLGQAREHGVRPWIALLLHSLGMHYRVRGRPDRSIPLLSEALDIRQSSKDEVGETYTRMQLGKVLPAAGELAAGLSHLDAALAAAERMNSPELVREIRMDRMEVLSTAGRIGDAAGELRAALEVCRRLDDEALTAEVLREARRLRVPV